MTVPLADVPNAVWTALIALIVVATGLLQEIFRNMRDAVAARERVAAAQKVATKVDAVKDSLEAVQAATDKKLDNIVATGEANVKTGQANHALLNSRMGMQLKITAMALRRLAENTKDPADNKIAEIAEKAASEHDENQMIVDNAVAASPAAIPTDAVKP